MKVRFPQYGYEVQVHITDDIEKVYKKIFKKNCKFKNETMAGLHNEDENGTSHIFLNKDTDAGIIAHESYHAIMAMFRWMGVEDFDEEIVAYNLQYLISKIKLP